jgi:hypothetical protein
LAFVWCAYQDFLALWKDADLDQRLLAQARTELAGLPKFNTVRLNSMRRENASGVSNSRNGVSG